LANLVKEDVLKGARIETRQVKDLSVLEGRKGLGLVKPRVTHSKSHQEPLTLQDSIPFASLLSRSLAQNMKPTFDHIALKMQAFLFEQSRVHDWIHGWQSLLLFQANDITSNFCERVLALSKLDGWRIKKALLECIDPHQNELFIQANLIQVESDVSLTHTSFNSFEHFQLVLDAPWPTNQILTCSVQDRYSKLFSFLARVYQASKAVHRYRQDHVKRADRLHLLSFINSFASYCMHSVVIPITSEPQWQRSTNLDQVFEMHESMLLKLENALFLHVSD
jgi:hypothetical protein